MLDLIFRRKKKDAGTNTGTSAETEPKEEEIQIVPLGGQSKVGSMNCMAVIDGSNAVLIDFGTKAQSEEVCKDGPDEKTNTFHDGKRSPDTSFLEDKNILMVCVTHVHRDHAGSLPVLCRQRPDITVMTDEVNAGIIQHILAEKKIESLPRFICGEVAQAGRFRIRKFPVHHSIEGSCGFLIEFMREGKAIWRFVHLGDFKTWIPYRNEETGETIDKNKEVFGALARDGPIDLVAMDATNAGKNNFLHISENRVQREISAILTENPGRVFITSPSSNTMRERMIIEGANKKGRPVYAVGGERQLFLHNARIAGWHSISLRKCKNGSGEWKFSAFSPSEGMESERTEEALYPLCENSVIFCSGGWGEQDSFLQRLAEGEIDLPSRHGDTLVVSNSIPSSAEAQSRFVSMFEKLSFRFAKIYIIENAPLVPTHKARFIKSPFLHAHGHASQEQKKVVFDHLSYTTKDGIKIRPKVVPVQDGQRIRKILADLVLEWGGEAIMLDDGEAYTVRISSPL